MLRKEREESTNAIEVKELAELYWAIFFLQADLISIHVPDYTQDLEERVLKCPGSSGVAFQGQGEKQTHRHATSTVTNKYCSSF